MVLGFGASLGLMNWAIYQSFARIPLGIAVTIEFVGPLVLAVLGSRRARDLVWVALAARRGAPARRRAGRPGRWGCCSRCSPAPRGRRTSCSARRPGAGGRASTGWRWPAWWPPSLLAPLALGRADGGARRRAGSCCSAPLVGLLSSVIPYSCELVALRSLRPAVFSMLMSLEPAAAALAGLVVLRELLSPVQWLAMACVVVASVGATRSGATIAEPAPD